MTPLPRIHQLSLSRPLNGPSPEGCLTLGPGHGVDAVTGGGLVALVHPAHGLAALWRGLEEQAGRLTLLWRGEPIPPASSLRLDSGGWERVMDLPGGGQLRERAVLPDSAPALILQWEVLGQPTRSGKPAADSQPGPEGATDPDSDDLPSSVQPTGQAPLLSLSPSGPDGEEGPALGLWHSTGTDSLSPQAVVLLPPGEEFSRIKPRLTPPHARERARANRSSQEPLQLHGPGIDLSRAFHELDRWAIGTDGEGRPTGPFLIGVTEGGPEGERPGASPRYARGAELAELGLGALNAGRPELAIALLRELAGEESPPPLPLLHLAGQIPAWTGRMAPLEEHRQVLDGAVEKLLRDRATGAGLGTASPPASLPGPLTVLRTLAQGVERSGDGWRQELETAQKALTEPERSSPGPASTPAPAQATPRPAASDSPATASSDAPQEPDRIPTRSLPVLMGPTDPPPPPAADADPTLPPPEAFAPLATSALANRRGLHTARLLRSWVEGRLGIQPDASSGRVSVTLDARELPVPFRVDGLRIGDCLMAIDCRLEEGTCSLGGYQTGGRVPLNLVLHLTTPFTPPLSVMVGGQASEVPGVPVEGGSRLSLQFPLDPERRIVVEPEVAQHTR